MNVNANNFGQVFTGNDTNGVFSHVSIKAMSKEEFIEEMEKNSSNDEAATVDISKEGKVKLLDVLGNGGKIHLEMTEQQKEERDVKEKAFQAMIQPAGANKIVSSKDLQTYNDFSSVVKANDPELADKINNLMIRIANREPGEAFGEEFISLMSQAGKVYQNAKNGNGAPILNDYNMMIGATAADFRAERDEKAYYGLSERAEDITKAYAKAYSDIVKGYEDGTRKAYVIDKDSETGYRLMTMEEELAELDKAYEKSTDNISAMVKQSDDIAKALEKYAEQLAKSKRTVNAEEVKKEHEKYTKELETLPKDLGAKMKSVAELFKENFKNTNMLSMDFVNSLMKSNYYVKKN